MYFVFFIDYLDKPGHPRKNAVSFHFHHFINISITFTSPSFWRIEWTDIGGVWNGTYVPWYVRFSHWILLSLSIPFLTFTFSILFGVLFHHKIVSPRIPTFHPAQTWYRHRKRATVLYTSVTMEVDNASAVLPSEGLRQYYITKIEDLMLTVSEKNQNLRRLQAQRNELNAKVRMLREELQLLQEQGKLILNKIKTSRQLNLPVE